MRETLNSEFASQRLNGIYAIAREAQAPEDTPEKLEEESIAAEEFIDTSSLLLLIMVIPSLTRQPPSRAPY